MVNVLGIDEAGRGPVIGPLVMVGFLMDEKDLKLLTQLGVKDSKQLTEARREELEPKLRELGEVFMEVIHPWQIDVENLNVLERKAAKRIIAAAKPNQAFVDAFEKNLDKKLQTQGVKIIAEYKADDTYPVVGAASIVAKVHRDRAIKDLAKKHGPMGSGYPSDPMTRKFVEAWIKEHKTIPDFIRKSWGTTRNIIEKAEQKPLTDF
ncbi:MAG: ribonuclease HII [Candidatus Altiarchaeota archaeon]|nr:ribonuclease HII [Candidatus Altiarchaeota archaeon]